MQELKNIITQYLSGELVHYFSEQGLREASDLNSGLEFLTNQAIDDAPIHKTLKHKTLEHLEVFIFENISGMGFTIIQVSNTEWCDYYFHFKHRKAIAKIGRDLDNDFSEDLDPAGGRGLSSHE